MRALKDIGKDLKISILSAEGDELIQRDLNFTWWVVNSTRQDIKV